MNSKAETSVLDTIIGAVIGIAVAVATISMVFFVINVGNPGQDSLQELARKVREVNANEPGANGLAVFFQEEESFYYPITKETRNQPFVRRGSNLFSNDLDFILSYTTVNPDCETKNCLCLCDEFEQEVTKHCKQGKLYCEQLSDVSFSPGTNHLITRVEEGGIGVFDLALISAGITAFPLVGPVLSAGVVDYVLEDPTPAPAQQRVQIINCRGGEKYCKNSKSGDISIIFDWLDQQGVYDSIK